MKQVGPILVILAILCLVGAWSVSFGRPAHQQAPLNPIWLGFLVLVPIVLGVLIWLEQPWAAMVCVIYGTVGLALDLATIVHVLTKDSLGDAALLRSGISGALNFLLIVFGGRCFLEVHLGPPPPGSRPPNPPSPLSSSTT